MFIAYTGGKEVAEAETLEDLLKELRHCRAMDLQSISFIPDDYGYIFNMAPEHLAAVNKKLDVWDADAAFEDGTVRADYDEHNTLWKGSAI